MWYSYSSLPGYYRSWYQLKAPTHRARAARARGKYTFYRFYTAPCGAPHTTPADFGISINLLLAAPAGHSNASACFYRTRKAQRVRDLCLVFWPHSWEPLNHIKSYRVMYRTHTKFSICIPGYPFKSGSVPPWCILGPAVFREFFLRNGSN